MRKFAKVDTNQKEIVDALRKAGATVQSLATVGKGCPDIVVGYRGKNMLMEIKRNDVPPSQQKLTADELAWHEAWRGMVAIVKSPEEALQAMEFMA